MQDSTLENKRIVKLWFERFSARDIEGALSLMTDDATWKNGGKPELLPTARVYDKAGLTRLFERMFERLETGLQMTVLETIGEGDRIAAEVESSGDLRNGRQYRQQYHFVFHLRAGKISAVREYLDTQHVYDIWFRE